MPGSPNAASRTWFGIARCTGNRIDIEGAIEPWTGRHDYAQILLLDEMGPIDWFLASPGEVDEQHIAEHLQHIGASLQRKVPPPLPDGDMSIAICTRDRPESLRLCLERMQFAVRDRYDVVVIDNAATSNESALVVEEAAARGMRIRLVDEPRAGLSRARNRALQECKADYVAFTDDDARPDRGWADAIHRGFALGNNVALVTGLVPPSQIENRTQALFERKLKWSNNLQGHVYSMARRHEYQWSFPFSAGHFGTGANFAVNREVVISLGGFDEALGAGTRTEGGEDLEIFVRVLRADYELAFHPSAIVWHMHRMDDAALRKIQFGYGKGLAAAAVSEFLHPGKLDMVRGTIRGAGALARDRRGEVGYGTPWDHLAIEILGLICGPFAYWSERRRGGHPIAVARSDLNAR